MEREGGREGGSEESDACVVGGCGASLALTRFSFSPLA